MILKSLVSPSPRLRQSYDMLITLNPGHPLSRMVQGFVDLPLQPSNFFPCYYDTLKSTLFSPPVTWQLRDKLSHNPDATAAEICLIAEECVALTPGATYVYTDGFKSARGTGSATYIDNRIQRKVRLTGTG